MHEKSYYVNTIYSGTIRTIIENSSTNQFLGGSRVSAICNLFMYYAAVFIWGLQHENVIISNKLLGVVFLPD